MKKNELPLLKNFLRSSGFIKTKKGWHRDIILSDGCGMTKTEGIEYYPDLSRDLDDLKYEIRHLIIDSTIMYYHAWYRGIYKEEWTDTWKYPDTYFGPFCAEKSLPEEGE